MTNKENEVLALLKNNARYTITEIAQMANITESQVKTIVKKLEDDRIIVKYTTIVNEKKLTKDDQKVRALIELAIRPQMRTGFDKIAARIAKFKQVVGHYLISGSYDFLIIVEGKNLEEISSFVSEKLASINHVEKTATHFIMKKYKENGVVIDDQAVIKRLAISA
ncbi:Lrp/AsnC family transcriptional regulator [Candidatus Margulisiibacteriota bacterium]